MMSTRRLSTYTQAASQLLTTPPNVKADLSITGSSEDAYITRMIAQASADAMNYCARRFLAETVVDTFYIPECADVLILSRMPIISISSVVADGVTIDAAEYRVESETGLLYRLDEDGEMSYWSAVKTVVTFSAGYASVPADLEGGVIALIKARRAARTRDPTVRSERVPDVLETTYWVRGPGDADLPPDVAGIFDRYRIHHI